MSKRSALHAVAFAATFVVGAVIGGAAVSFRTISPMAVMVARANLVMVGKDAYVMYRYAAYPVARSALLKVPQTNHRIPCRQPRLNRKGRPLTLA